MSTVLLPLHYQNEVLHERGNIKVGVAEGSDSRSRVRVKGAAMLAAARRDGIAIVHVRIAFAAGHTDVIQNCKIFRDVVANNSMVDGSWGAEFHEGLGPVQGETVIRHNRVNAFYGTNLEETLRALNAEQLVIAGVSTNSVVETTVRHAADAGYEVAVVADACSAGRDELHHASLENMKYIADVMTLDELLARAWRLGQM
ncbi:MAG TPA: isochorismatase family cysteine hydrolase [Magnetospirillaceae bacterium]|jgi:nicotinamidase-related amidase